MLPLTLRQGGRPESGTLEGLREKRVVQWETKCIPCGSAAFLHIAGIQMVSVGGRRSLVNCGKRCVYVQVIIFSAVDFFIGFLWSERLTETYLKGAAVCWKGPLPSPSSPSIHASHWHTEELRAQALFPHLHEAAGSAVLSIFSSD